VDVGIALVVMAAAVAMAFAVYYRRRDKQARHHSDLELTGSQYVPLDGSSMMVSGAGSSSGSRGSTGPLAVAKMSKDPNQRHPWQLQYSELKVGEMIGAGSFGMVFKGSLKQQVVAIKRMNLSSDPDARATEMNSANQEMTLLWDLRHPNILR
jgi:serine/threonine protein kinase